MKPYSNDPGLIIAENESFIAIIEEKPLVLGHCVVFPKQEIDSFIDLSNDQISGIMVFAKSIAHAIEKVVPCKKIGIAVIGLQLRYAHLHLVPINTADDLNFTRSKMDVSKDELVKMATQIRANLSVTF